MFDNLKITTRLIAAFSIGVLFIRAIGVIGCISMKKTGFSNEDSAHYKNETIPLLEYDCHLCYPGFREITDAEKRNPHPRTQIWRSACCQI
jgi:hypothetical protein